MNVFKRLLAATSLLVVFAATAEAQIRGPSNPSENCVAQSEMQAIANNFPQFANLARAEYCYDGSANANLISSLMFMRKTAFAANMTPSKDELFSGKFSKSWYDYFVGRINKLTIAGSCPKGVVAYVYSFGGKTMYACPLALTDTFSSLDRASVFMHEARHIDGFPHITCSSGPRKGLNGACDQRISDGGSYAVTVETYAQLGHYALDVHPALRAYARASATVYAAETFQTPARVNKTENLLLLTSSLDYQLMNMQNGQIKQLGKAANAGHIIHRGVHLIMFPEDKNLISEYVFANNEGQISQTPGDVFAEYNASSPAEKAQLVDFHSSTQWNARVYKSMVRFACDPNAATITDIQVPAGQVAAGLVYPNGYERDVYAAHVAMENGDVYDLGCANTKAFLRPSSLKLDQKYKRLYKVAGQTVGLLDGKLFSVNNGLSSPFATPFDGKVVEITPQQTFEFFESAN